MKRASFFCNTACIYFVLFSVCDVNYLHVVLCPSSCQILATPLGSEYCVCVCLCVCARAYLRNYVPSLHQCYACYRRSWLGPALIALRYVTYFRLYG